MPEPDAPPTDQGNSAQPGPMEVALLHDLSRWREALARSIARNNLELRSDQITAGVNRILFPLLLLRIAEDRHLVPAGTLADIRDFRTVTHLIIGLIPYADALYAEEPPSLSRHPDPKNDLILEDRVIRGLLDTLLSPDRRYVFGQMPTAAIAQVMRQYLTRTIRRSAAHQATVVDTHDTVVSGGMVIPPLSLIKYMVRQVLVSAWKGRSAREILPLQVLDPACGSGTVLLALYRHLLENAGGSMLTFEERREILAHSVYGLDINRHAVAVTRMLLFLELCDCRYDGPAEGEFHDTVQTVLRDLRHTILCGNALVGPEIVHDESWMFCPVRDRHTLNSFSYKDRFPEIVAGGGFGAVVCNPPEGALEQREWIQQYFQRQYSVYHPLIDRSVYFLEKSLSLLRPGGVVSCVLRNRWLRGSGGSPLREVINARQIEEIVDLSAIPAGKPGGTLCSIRVCNTPPSHPFPAVIARAAFFDDPDAFVAAHGFPVDQRLLDKGGWALCDTRIAKILKKVKRHSTSLEDFVMGQIHAGIRIPEGDPFVINETLAREWIRRDPRCKTLIRRVVAGMEIGRYHSGRGRKYLILIPPGWTVSHPQAAEKPWQWLKHRHPLIARHLQPFREELVSRAGPDSLWWENACDVFWHQPRKKILFPARFRRLAFLSDTGWGIGDHATNAILSSGLYLPGILNSRLIEFVFDNATRQSAPDLKFFTWDDIRQLPIYLPDFDLPEDLARHDRMEKLVQRRIDLENSCRAVKTDRERETFQKKIRATDAGINALVYELSTLTADEITVVEKTMVK